MRMNFKIAAMTMTLATLATHASASVTAVTGDGSLRRRLLELGLVPGVPVKLLRRAPLGDPLVIQVRGYDLSLRRAEAERVEVQP